jgi:hypothetical protein
MRLGTFIKFVSYPVKVGFTAENRSAVRWRQAAPGYVPVRHRGRGQIWPPEIRNKGKLNGQAGRHRRTLYARKSQNSGMNSGKWGRGCEIPACRLPLAGISIIFGMNSDP